MYADRVHLGETCSIVQDQTFFAVAVDAAEVSFDGQDQLERATIDKHGWLDRPKT